MTRPRRPKQDDDDWSSERPWSGDGIGSYNFTEYANVGSGDPVPDKPPIGFIHFPSTPAKKRKRRKR